MVEQLVGVADAARRLGLTPERVRQLAKASRLPPAVGRIGRQDVWRWRDVAAWAAATGRLPEAEAGGRQPVRAWLPGSPGARRKVVDAVETWGDRGSVVHVRIWDAAQDPDEPPVVVLGNLDDNSANSVTNRFEDVAMEVGARHLGPRTRVAQFYDHWATGAAQGGQFHHVSFTVATDTVRPRHRRFVRPSRPDPALAIGGRLCDPQWRATGREEVERLTGETVDVYLPGTYTTAMLDAVAHDPEQRVGAVWDPARSRDAVAAIRIIGASPQHAVIRAALVRYAIDGAAHAIEAVTGQATDAPVWLVAPDLPDAGRLAEDADDESLEDHHRLWRALTSVRAQLRRVHSDERRMLVPSVVPGWARIHWSEAGVDEPEDRRDGALGPIVLPEDLLGDVTQAEPLALVDALRLAETALVAALSTSGGAHDPWDVPAARISGPFPSGTPTARRYLNQVTWKDPDVHDPDRSTRLRAALRRGGSAAVEGVDADGNLVAWSGDGRMFALEWPTGTRRRPDELVRATVRADPSRHSGAVPVFLDLQDGTVVPLPSSPAVRPAHEYTWGYAGTGPSNLANAVLMAVHAVVDQSDPAFDAATTTVQALVRGGATPAWNIGNVIDQARRATTGGPS